MAQIMDEWDEADIENKGLPRIHIGDCGHSTHGHWEVKFPEAKGGVLCWRGCYSDGEGSWVLWPRELRCRNCGKVEQSLKVQKSWNTPYLYDHNDKTFSCGCEGVDSSG